MACMKQPQTKRKFCLLWCHWHGMARWLAKVGKIKCGIVAAFCWEIGKHWGMYHWFKWPSTSQIFLNRPNSFCQNKQIFGTMSFGLVMGLSNFVAPLSGIWYIKGSKTFTSKEAYKSIVQPFKGSLVVRVQDSWLNDGGFESSYFLSLFVVWNGGKRGRGLANSDNTHCRRKYHCTLQFTDLFSVVSLTHK